ncbi:MAG: acyltransferase [Oleiphilaceae bacterium]|nr:acyltransferase [Oleiphilaceae bacterium]
MLHFLPQGVRGTLAVLLILINTLFWYPLLMLLAIIKLVIPWTPVRKLCTRGLNRIAVAWINNNGHFMALLHRLEWHVEGLEKLERNQWYFVTCNHQSWADIMVTQNVLNGRIPLMKFFLKKELIWVPLLGLAWWALDFPFMKRYTKEQLQKKPELRGKDLETTRKACEKFKYTPVTVFNFLEGTRFTPEKHRSQNSPYQHLLRPKAGGVGFVLGAMGEQLHVMLDITIVYPDGVGGIWDYLSGRMERIVVSIQRREIPAQFLGRDYVNDAEFREAFQQWVTQLWQEKDQRFGELQQAYARA